MKLEPQQFFHGDLAILSISDYEDILTVRLLAPNPVLAHGSSTGHSHVLESVEGVRMFEVNDAEKRRLSVCVMELEKPVRLIHDGANPDHDPIELPPGNYLVRRQREIGADMAEHMVVD